MTPRWGLLALLALAGGGLAQTDVVDWASIEIAPFEELVQPLQGLATTDFTARASCLLADPTQGAVVVTYRVVDGPAWATVLVSPTTDARNAAACDQGYLAFEGTVSVTASDQAPGFTPAPITIEMAAGPADRSEEATAVVNVSASYFSILDVQLAETQAVIPPGGAHDFVAKVTNLGNANTRVEASLLEAGEGLTVLLPPPTTLQSRQLGGREISAEIPFHVEAAADGGFVNRVGVVSVRLTSAYASDDSYPGDESTLSFLVTIRSGAADEARDLPLAPWASLVALFAAALLTARRSARRSGSPAER